MAYRSIRCVRKYGLPEPKSRTETGTPSNSKLRHACRGLNFKNFGFGYFPFAKTSAMGAGDEALDRVVSSTSAVRATSNPAPGTFGGGLQGNPPQAGGLVLTTLSVLHHTGRRRNQFNCR